MWNAPVWLEFEKEKVAFGDSVDGGRDIGSYSIVMAKNQLCSLFVLTENCVIYMKRLILIITKA